MTPKALERSNRVWTNPDGEKERASLICLRSDALVLAVIPPEDLDKTAAAVAAGGEVPARTLPLKTITQLQGDAGDNELSITYKQGENETDSLSIALIDSSKRDELLEALKNQLDWDLERKQVSRFSASLWPLGVTAGIALFTWIMHSEALEIAAGKHLHPVGSRAKTRFFSTVMHWVEAQIGATGVLIAGGILLLGSLLWLTYALLHPPTRITVSPRQAGAI